MGMDVIFCVFCETGKETRVETFLEGLGYRVVSSVSERSVIKAGKRIKELRPLLSGYVFFAHTGEPDWNAIDQFEYIFYPLRYSDGTSRMRGNDLKFVQWLIRHNGVIEISRAIKTGTKIKIIDGPLKEYEGNIIKINGRQKSAAVQIDSDGMIHTIWLSYELIEEV